MPTMAPVFVVFLYQTPITSAANRPAAAMEKAQATRNRMSAPALPAVQAAASATMISRVREMTSRRAVGALRSIIL